MKLQGLTTQINTGNRFGLFFHWKMKWLRRRKTNQFRFGKNGCCLEQSSSNRNYFGNTGEMKTLEGELILGSGRRQNFWNCYTPQHLEG